MMRPANRGVAANIDQNSDCRRYLSALFGRAPADAHVELRLRTAAGMARAFYRAQDVDAIANAIQRHAITTDVYVGVIPRARQASRRNALVDSSSVLWVDCDSDLAVANLAQFAPAPSVVVMSGTNSNCHAYWLLSEPAALADVEDGNRRLAVCLGADGNCADAARILRPPSRNFKHVPPADVVLISCEEDARHHIDDVVRPCGLGTTHAPAAPCIDVLHDDPLLDVAPAVYVERLTGLIPRSRKVACPFHADRTPSFHVYAEPARGWYCYSCRRGGSVYDLAAELWRLPTRGAAFSELRRRLDELFDHRDLGTAS